MKWKNCLDDQNYDCDYVDDADKDEDDEQPANVDEDAGVGEDDGEEAESIAACRDDHQSLSPTNPNEEKDEDGEAGLEDDDGSGCVAVC